MLRSCLVMSPINTNPVVVLKQEISLETLKVLLDEKILSRPNPVVRARSLVSSTRFSLKRWLLAVRL